MKNSRPYEISDGAGKILRVPSNDTIPRKNSNDSNMINPTTITTITTTTTTTTSPSTQENHVKIKNGRHWLRRRTGLERVLLALSFALFVGLIATITVFIAGKEPTLCTSEVCIHAASQILYKLDPSVDPCQDFYRFTCGGFLSKNVVPDDELMKSTLQIIQEEVYTIVKKLIEDPTSPNDTASIIKAKKLYHSCLNENWTAEEDGRSVVESFLDSVNLGKWPMLSDSWIYSDTEIERTMSILIIYKVQPFIEAIVYTDEKNASVYTLQLYRGKTAMESDFYLNESHATYVKYMNLYTKLMMDTIEHLGVYKDKARQEINQMLSFEKKLANLTQSKYRKNDSNDTLDNDENSNKMTADELQEQIPGIKWIFMLNYVFENLNFTTDNPSLIPLVIHNKNYLLDLMTMLNSTPKRVILNYLMWRFVLKYMPYLNQKFSRMYSEFRREVPDPLESNRIYFSRWKECVAITNDGFGLVLGSLYATNHFPYVLETEIHDLVKELKSAFVDIIPKQKWMDDDTKDACKKKIWNMGKKIGYPKHILDPSSLEEEYDGLEIQETNLLGNMLRIKRFEMQKELKKLQRPVNKEKDWYGSPLDVNAFYRPNFNEIVFPAGILRFPFFNTGLPSYLKFGSIGVVIGHEITHGFDNYGRKFDKDGDLTQWWPDQAIEKFIKEATCFTEQYGKYKMDLIEEHVDGNATLGDNICDNAGLKHAYLAYQKWKQINGPPPRLPGIDFTPEQLFFIQYGQIWCEVVSKEGYIKYLKDSHSPGRFRTIGVMSNSPEFAEAFQCHLGSPMNPERKCHLWV